MLNKSWREIWNGKGLGDYSLGNDEFENFCLLKKIDGFDVSVKNEKAYFEGFYLGWNLMIDQIRNLISSFKSVYEVGCGCGVNLYMFKNRYPNLLLGGGRLFE